MLCLVLCLVLSLVLCLEWRINKFPFISCFTEYKVLTLHATQINKYVFNKIVKHYQFYVIFSSYGRNTDPNEWRFQHHCAWVRKGNLHVRVHILVYLKISWFVYLLSLSECLSDSIDFLVSLHIEFPFFDDPNIIIKRQGNDSGHYSWARIRWTGIHGSQTITRYILK